jgi:multiple sugar transport system permease protein
MFILQIIGVFQLFYEPMVLTDGGPSNASVSLMLLNYRYAFVNFQMGKAVATGIIIFFMLLIFTAFYLKFNKEKEME